jgi:hypothetical protein
MQDKAETIEEEEGPEQLPEPSPLVMTTTQGLALSAREVSQTRRRPQG